MRLDPTPPDVAVDVCGVVVAVLVSWTGLPVTAVPPVEQVPLAIGPQMKKLTVPVGKPASGWPVAGDTSAVSVTVPPSLIALSVTVVVDGVVTVLEGTFATLKHSVLSFVAFVPG